LPQAILQYDPVEKTISEMCRKQHREYSDYSQAVAPASASDFFRRWLFSYCSIQTSWQRNVIIYNALKDLKWLGDKEQLRTILIDSGAGMYNNRTNNIHKFAQDYWKDPSKYYGQSDESWLAYRNRLADTIPGMGLTKSAFVLEMTWPVEAQVVCLDVHMLRLYGLDKGVTDTVYKKVEDHWVKTCNDHNIAPPIARWIWWDTNQGYDDPGYWASLFADERNWFTRKRLTNV
jgi:thermostable 8-oxoguanine DNA glycosylase